MEVIRATVQSKVFRQNDDGVSVGFGLGKRSVIAAAVFLAYLSGPLSLPGKQYSFKVYSQQDGLRNQVINCLLQDHKGFLWVGTQNGLYRYDGNRFVWLGQNQGLPDQTIQSLYESPGGILWVGTRLGLATYDGERFAPDRDLGTQELFGYSNIVADSHGQIYIGTAKGLAVRKDGSSSPHVSFRFLTKGPVHGVYVDPSDTVWFGAEDTLCHFRTGFPVEVSKAPELRNNRWDSMLLDAKGTLWARSSERLVFLRKGGKSFESVRGISHSPEFGSLYQTKDGRLFVPTVEALMRFDGTRWERIGSRQGLASDAITCLFQDREGSVWVGLDGGGLERWLGFNEWESWKITDGLTSNIIWSLKRDPGGQMWVSTENGVLAQDPITGNWNYKAGRGLSVPAMVFDTASNAVWYGANPGGVFRLDRVTGRVQRFGVSAGITSDRVDNLFFDNEHYLWAATRAGLFRGTVVGSRVQFELRNVPYSDGNESFFGHLVDHLGRLWVTGSRGIVLWEGGHWRRFSRSDGLMADGVSHIAETPDGAIWLGYLSNTGISRLIYENDKCHFTHFTTANGLTSNGTVFVGADSRGWVWVGSDDGIDVYRESNWTHYGKADGLVWDDCDSLAFLPEQDGSVWIGTSGGISHFTPHANSVPEVQPYITSIVAGPRELSPSRPEPIPYRDRSLSIGFAAPTFLNEPAVRFRYRLVGLEQEWVDADDRWVRYPNLNAGKYSFEVLARSARGVWSKRVARADLIVLTPWWQTSWFRVLLAVLAASLARLLWRFRIRYLMRRQEHLVSLLTQAQNANRSKSEALAKVTQGEAREKNRNYVLELIGSHQPVGMVLDSIVKLVEADDPETLCLILFLENGAFQKGASNRLPLEFANLFDGLPESSLETCFATAVRRVETISVEEAWCSPFWNSYADTLREAGITCTRSAPILSSSAAVLGTVTYFRRSSFPDLGGSLVPLESVTRLAGVAIEHLSLYEQLSYRAQYDALTGLPNRVLFQDRLRQAIVRAERYGRKLFVLGIDLDGFKHVNDTLGHQAGDAVLKHVALKISKCLRKGDTAARMGGDEFTVILENQIDSQEVDVDAVVKKLITAIGEPMRFGNLNAAVTASVGVSAYPDDTRDAEELMKNADVAMYHVKRLGKNAYKVFGPEIGTVESNRVQVESCLRTALAAGEFELHYQPQYRTDRTLTGFEALLRWKNPTLGMVPPGVFIPIAEETGLIVPIGQWVLEEACRQTAAWNIAGYTDFRVGVNVSAFQFAKADFPESVSQFLRVMGIPPEQIELELTETSIMSDVGKSSAQLRELRNLGLAVWIDDFGTGYSSLSYLQRLPVAGIKIDRSFVNDLSSEPASALPMIEAIVNLANNLNLRVIAEGVETEEQLQFLRNAGCDLAQGFLFNRALPVAEATHLLNGKRENAMPIPEPMLALR